MTTITELKKLLFSMILKTPIWLVHLAANQSSVMSIPSWKILFIFSFTKYNRTRNLVDTNFRGVFWRLTT